MLPLVLVGCIAQTETPTSDSSTVDADGECEGVGSLSLRMCVDTTAPLPPEITDPNDPGPAATHTGTGVVSEVGALAPVGGAAPNGFQACDASVADQLRLIDGAGHTWTFGWALDQDQRTGLLDGFVDSEIAFTLHHRAENIHARDVALLLSDARGPLLLLEDLETRLESGGLLTESERGGLYLATDEYDSCEPRPYDHHQRVTVSWDEGSAALFSGERTTVPVEPGPRDLSFLLTSARIRVYSDCFTGCNDFEWIAWAMP
jgi:hypothetical protein